MSDEKKNIRDQIMQVSLMLFNEYGYQHVPLIKIAQHIGISPGHLGYYFKAKSDIVMTVFPLLENAIRSAKVPGGHFLPRDIVLREAEFARALWRYRFFFDALRQILHDDETRRRRFLEFQEGIVGSLEALFEGLMANGHMVRSNLPTTTRILAQCCWMIWLSWLRFEQMENPGSSEAPDMAVYEGIRLSFAVVQTYLTKPFVDGVLLELNSSKSCPKNTVSAAAKTSRRRISKAKIRGKKVRQLASQLR